MLITSPKTEHHERRGTRIVPIFIELEPYLSEAFELANEGAEHVINRYRDATQNLRTTFLKIIHRAGLEPWPKLFVNLRASAATDLVERFPAHVANSWMGRCESVAREHYRQVTDGHFERATHGSALQNALQQAQERRGNGSQLGLAENENTPVLQGCATKCELLLNGQMEDRGLEPRCQIAQGINCKCLAGRRKWRVSNMSVHRCLRSAWIVGNRH